MAKVYEAITADMMEFIGEQPLFFVATAPLGEDGHVNLSPKGMEALRVLGPLRVAYLDLTGSGNETAAHVAENGRITFMFCAFKGRPNILRLYGKARIVLPDTDEWEELYPQFPDIRGARQIFVADIDRVQTSCGFAVPLMDFVGQRDTLVRWAEAKDDEELLEYRAKKNTSSIDGLPSPTVGVRVTGNG